MSVLRCGLVLGVLSLGLPGCGDPAPPAGAGPSQAAAAAEEDKDAAEMLADRESVAEARAWLAGDPAKRKLWKGDRAAIVKLVDDLYQAGATNVSVVGLLKEGPIEVAAMFVVTLPAQAQARAQVFQVHNAFWKSALSEEASEDLEDILIKDVGQKYLVINFDL